METHFEWDRAKAEANAKKHGVPSMKQPLLSQILSR
jgi:uncharacterized DUF497 family protein